MNALLLLKVTCCFSRRCSPRACCAGRRRRRASTSGAAFPRAPRAAVPWRAARADCCHVPVPQSWTAATATRDASRPVCRRRTIQCPFRSRAPDDYASSPRALSAAASADPGGQAHRSFVRRRTSSSRGRAPADVVTRGACGAVGGVAAVAALGSAGCGVQPRRSIDLDMAIARRGFCSARAGSPTIAALLVSPAVVHADGRRGLPSHHLSARAARDLDRRTAGHRPGTRDRAPAAAIRCVTLLRARVGALLVSSARLAGRAPGGDRARTGVRRSRALARHAAIVVRARAARHSPSRCFGRPAARALPIVHRPMLEKRLMAILDDDHPAHAVAGCCWCPRSALPC